MIDSYFDLNSFDSPVKTALTQKYVYYMDGDRKEEVDIYIKETDLELLDDYKQVENVKGNKFYTVKEQIQNSFNSGSGVMTAFSIFLDPEVQYYSRNVYTVTDFLAQIGGIFGLLSSLVGVLVGFYSERMIYYTILSKCYSFDTENLNKNEKQKQEILCTQRSLSIKNTDVMKNNEEIKDDEVPKFEESKTEKRAEISSKNPN
jgi:hypothetical protein